ncbi:MAG TPA: pentapeptide repeat-containing protein, partial [Microlunatus sp.]|nr:pentapeptide repeat-containing protein [Microlunatus sp.]
MALTPGADLRSCDLRSRDIAGSDLTGANLSRAVLAGVSLDPGPDGPRTLLIDASLVRADLTGAT